MAEQPTVEEIKAMTRATFNAAAAKFDDPRLSFWNVVGARTAELAGILEGSRVLDVCCGSGASALPAARLAGSSGSVVGVDFAEKLLELGRRKAEQEELANLTFEQGDMTDLRYPIGSFDVVQCVFGIFFIPDMAGTLAHLWDKVAPGGTIAITVWGKRVVEPLNTMCWDCVEAVRPDLLMKTPPWLRLVEASGFSGLFLEAGLPEPELVLEEVSTPLGAEDAWTVMEGSGYRAIIDRMQPDEVERFKEMLLARLRVEHRGRVISDVHYGRAHREG